MTESRVQPVQVVEAFDVVEDGEVSPRAIGERLPSDEVVSDELTFECSE